MIREEKKNGEGRTRYNFPFERNTLCTSYFLATNIFIVSFKRNSKITNKSLLQNCYRYLFTSGDIVA